MGSSIKSTYKVFKDSSPYTKKGRYDNPKDIFKGIVSHIKKQFDCDRPLKAIDIGCANGEFLYYLKKECPAWGLKGVDITPEFIETAKSFSGLDGVDFETKNLFEIEGEQYDVIFCIGTFQIFRDVSKPLDKLLDICKPGGFIFIESLFNKYNMDVHVEFSDNSRAEMKGVWRSDFNQHSYYTIEQYLKDKAQSFHFHELPMEFEKPYDPKNPSTFVFTFRDENGKNIVTNGMNLMLDSTLLTIQK